MTSRNDITGDSLSSKKNSDSYREGWDAIFGKKDEEDKDETSDEGEEE